MGKASAWIKLDSFPDDLRRRAGAACICLSTVRTGLPGSCLASRSSVCFHTLSGRLGKRPFRLKDLPNYILMELWMIWNMVPYLWYRLVIVKFDLK